MVVSANAVSEALTDWAVPRYGASSIWRRDATSLKSKAGRRCWLTHPNMALSRRRNFNNRCSGVPAYSRKAPFSNLNVDNLVSTPS